MVPDVIAAGSPLIPGATDGGVGQGPVSPAEPPVYVSDWHFQVLEMPALTWVDRDLNLFDAEVTRTVSGAAVIRGRLPLGDFTGAVLRRWGHLLIAEDGEGEPVVAIVDSLKIDDSGEWLLVEAGGFSQVPTGQPWVDLPYSGTLVDPLDVVRMIWGKLQSKPGGNLGVTVDPLKSSVRLGTPESPARTNAKAGVAAATKAAADAKAVAVAAAKAQEAARVAVMTACGKTKAGLFFHQDTAPGGDRRSTKHVWIDKNAGNKAYIWNGKKWVLQTVSSTAVITSRLATWVASKTNTTNAKAVSTRRNTELTAAKKKLSDVKGGEADPWTMSWWETLDLGQVISELARDTPFEWRERATWAADYPALRLELGSPAVGARREDLLFEIGVNVTAIPPLEAVDHVSEVTVLGAGEGRAMRRAIASGNPGRIRRAAVVQRKDIRSNDAAGAAARAELSRRSGTWETDTLLVIDHPHAPYGAFREGDRVRLIGDAGWAELDMWVRIDELTITCSTGAMTLKVSRG